jgi:hypothetical protein
MAKKCGAIIRSSSSPEMTSKSECNNEVTGPQADVSGMYPRNALQAASNPKSHVLRQIEYFYQWDDLIREEYRVLAGKG